MFDDADNFNCEFNELSTMLYDTWEEKLSSSYAMDHEGDNSFMTPSMNFTDCLNSFSCATSVNRLRKEETTDCFASGEERLSLGFEKDESPSDISYRNNKDIRAIFSRDQISCIYTALIQRGDASRLQEFLQSVPKEWQTKDIQEALVRIQIDEALNQKDFSELFFLIENNRFDPSSHRLLQEIWYKGHYLEAEKVRGRSLGAVDKYRLRKKYPPPETIWDGERTEYCFRVGSRQILRDSYKRNRYPSLEEKRVLTTTTGLTITQINNWYKNRRQRDKPQQQQPPTSAPSSAMLTSHSYRCPHDISDQLHRGSNGVEWRIPRRIDTSPPSHLQYPLHHSSDGLNDISRCAIAQPKRIPLMPLNQVQGGNGSSDTAWQYQFAHR